MSQENVEIVRQVFDAWRAGDYEAALAAYHPDVVYDATVLPEGRVYRGRKGLAEAIRVWAGTWIDWTWEVEELIDAGDRVVAATRQSGRGKGSGVNVVQETFGIFSLRDRQIVDVTIVLDRAEALEAVGLRE